MGLSVWLNRWYASVIPYSQNIWMKPCYVRKKGGQHKFDHENNGNIVRAVIDNDQHLSKRSLEALLHIPWMIIHCILTEQLVIVCVASTRLLHMLTSNEIQIHTESTSKFLGLIAEDLPHLNWVVTCDKASVHHYDLLTKQERALEEER